MENIETIIPIYAFTLATLIAIVRYFFKKMIDNLTTSIKNLESSTSNLVTSTELLKQSFDESKTQCKDKHGIVDKRLMDHSKKIADHEKRLTIIEISNN